MDTKQPTTPKKCSLMYDHGLLTFFNEHGPLRRILTGL